jgi:TPP-dependent pyruvate/acetoin dehydrogenase alpha subunit
LAIAAEDVELAAKAFKLCDDLARDYLAVADDYRRGANVAQQHGEPTLVRWMTLRARLHTEHSSFLDG